MTTPGRLYTWDADENNSSPAFDLSIPPHVALPGQGEDEASCPGQEPNRRQLRCQDDAVDQGDAGEQKRHRRETEWLLPAVFVAREQTRTDDVDRAASARWS